jgi:hypothetical protein
MYIFNTQDNNDIGHLPVEKILQYEYEFLKRRSKRLESWNEHFSNTKSQNLKNSMTIRTVRLFRWVSNEVLDIISQIDESQKVTVPAFIDRFIGYAKAEGMSLFIAMDNAQNKESEWIITHEDTFARAWLDGYEIEKEKLYTAMLKISGEYLRIDCNGNFDHFRVSKKYILDGARGYQFTEDDLVKYHILRNDNYEVKEVEE